MENTQQALNQSTPKSHPLNPPTHYVGIGASAGGLEALEEFFNTMPNATGMTFIIVQHLSPDYKSMMVELLSRKTPMQVLQIEDGMTAEADCIYLIPPKKNLEIYHAQLFLTEQQRDTGLYLPIDIFFRSLAIDQRKKAIGIILSGTGSDGTLGLRAIKEQGGLVMVQDYSSAKFDGMPKSAIATGLADYILDAGRMSDALVKYIKHPLVINADKAQELNKEETDFMKILSLIRTHVGEDFSYYKPKTIIRRIERRISVNQIQDTDEYIELLRHSKQECEILAKEFLIGVTQFFRDREAYEPLEQGVIPKLFSPEGSDKPIRIWSAACSTGEEAYSIAILCKEYLERHDIQADLKIFATDLDKEAVKFAGLGSYPESIVSDVSQERLQRFFLKKHESYQVNEDLRQMVIFSHHNVLTDPPFSNIDLIICRNLLIYLKPDMQQKVLGLFQYSLSDGGYLLLGSSESLSGVSDAFETIHSKWKIFKHKSGFAPPMLANLLNVRTRLPSQTRAPLPDVAPSSLRVQKQEQAALYEQVVNYLAPAGVIVDAENTVVHFFQNSQCYLNFPAGKANYNLLELADPQLTTILSNMLYKVRKTHSDVTFSKVKFTREGQDSFLNLSAHPIQLKKGGGQGFVVIAIHDSQADDNKAQHDEEEAESRFDYNEQASERIRELERELQYREENLQTTVEELETSNEELQATNEELVSSNEELQSTNEELQSVNEELYTVNSQYQEKIKELTILNNDINNLLANTQIGTLFLDSQLTVRKFTPEISKLINVMDVDIGRPFSHLTFNCDRQDLYQDVADVLETLVPAEREIHAHDGEWYLLKIQPYRHADRSIHGVLLTQVQITILKEALAANLKSEEQYRALFETMTQGVVSQNAGGDIIAANPAAERILGLSLDQLLGRRSLDPRWKAVKESGDDFPGEEHPVSVALRSGEIVKDVVMGIFNPALNRTRWLKVTGVPYIRPGEDKPFQVYAIFDDITEQKNAEEQLRRQTLETRQANQEINQVSETLADTVEQLDLSRKAYAMLFHRLPMGFAYHKILTDEAGTPVDYKFLDVNDAFEQITGLSRQQVLGKTVKQVLPDIGDFWIQTFGQVALTGEACEFEHETETLGTHFTVSAYSPETGYFVAVFDKIRPSS